MLAWQRSGLYWVLLLTLKVMNFCKFTSYCSLKPLWSGLWYLADPTSPIPSHCASVVATITVRVKYVGIHTYIWQQYSKCITVVLCRNINVQLLSWTVCKIVLMICQKSALLLICASFIWIKVCSMFIYSVLIDWLILIVRRKMSIECILYLHYIQHENNILATIK